MTYNGSVVTLMPATDWEGTEQTIFTATDNGGCLCSLTLSGW